MKNGLDSLLTKNQLLQYCHKLIWDDKLSQNTVKRKLASLNKFCQWAKEKGLINKNPFQEGEEKKEEIPLWVRVGVPVLSVVFGLVILRVSTSKLPFPPPEKPIFVPPEQVLSQISWFGKELNQVEKIGESSKITLTASESALLANLSKKGQISLPQSLGVEAKNITLRTTAGYEGNITFNPDGQGVLNLIFEGKSPKQVAGIGGFVNIQNANLQEGNLIYGGVGNDQNNFNFLQFQSGANLEYRFTVSGRGDLTASGGLNLGSGKITSDKNLIFSPQDQPTLTIAPKQSLLTGNLAIAGQIYDGGLGIFGTTGERLPQAFNFKNELTVEFEFLTGSDDLKIKFNLNEKGDRYYQAVWQTNKTFAIQACAPDCSPIGSVTFFPFEKTSWHHGRLHINNSSLTWELDLSAQKVSVPVEEEKIPLLSSGYIEFSNGFAAIANLRISQGGSLILTSGHAQVGGNLEVKGSLRVGQLSTISSSTHVCRNASGDLAECAADYTEWYPVALELEEAKQQSSLEGANQQSNLEEAKQQRGKAAKRQSSKEAKKEEEISGSLDLWISGSNIGGTIVSITNTPNPINDPTALYLAAPADKPYDGNLLGVLGNPNLGANGQKLAENYQPLVLAGRVPVKVTDLNGPIKVGDLITSSAIPGVGVRATEAGMVVGKALEEFNGENGQTCPQPFNNSTMIVENPPRCGKILIFLNPGWWEAEEKRWEVGSGKLDDKVGQAPPSRLRKLVDHPEIEESPGSQLTSLLIERLRTTGQREIADQLLTQALKIQGEATTSGQEEKETPQATASALLAQVEEFIKELSEKKQDTYPHFPLPDSLLASDFPIATNLTVLGQTSLGQTTIAGNLLVDSSLQLGVNSLNSLTGTLYLQNYGFGDLDILGGKVKIDSQGNLAVAGNAEIEKDLKVKKSLFANLLKPLEGGEIVIEGHLKTKGSGTFNKIIIASAEENEETNSSKTLNTPYQITTNATAGTAILPAGKTEITIVNQAVTDNSLVYLTPLSPTENKVLFVKVKKGEVQCPKITPTPEANLSPTPQSLTPLCLPQPGYFTVGIDEAIEKEIEFNWWVIN